MTLAALIQTYGYVVIFLGVLIEGETTLILGGFMAHQGYLFGRTLSSTVGPLRHYEFTVLGLLVIAGAITWAFYRYRHRVQTPK